MVQKLPDIVIETIMKALQKGILIQKQARLCDLAALDFIPTEILPYLKLHHQKAIAISSLVAKESLSSFAIKNPSKRDSNEDNSIKRKSSKNIDTDIKLLCQLSRDENWRTRAKVAANKSTPVDVLAKLADDSHQQYWLTTRSKSYIKFPIQIAVAKNPSTPGYILENLFKKKELFICKAVAKNPGTPISLLKKMEIEEDYIVYKYMHLKQKMQIKYIQEDLFIQDFFMVYSNLAENPNLPVNIMKRLSRHRNFDVRINIIDNINTPLYILHKMYISSYEKHEKKRILSRVASIYKEKAGNLATSIEQLQEILRHEDIEVRLAVIQHPLGLSLLLDRCLKPERCLPEFNSLNRVLAGMHPEISQQ